MGGRSTGNPITISGAVTMKMMSSTSITSTKGVTLISCMGVCLRARLRRPPPGLDGGWTLAAMGALRCSGAYVDLPRDDRRELVGKGFQSLTQPRRVGRELVVE